MLWKNARYQIPIAIVYKPFWCVHVYYRQTHIVRTVRDGRRVMYTGEILNDAIDCGR